MLKRWTWMTLILIAMATMWGCSSDDGDPVTPGQTAFEAMAEAGEAYVNDNTDCPGVIGADVLFGNGVENYTIFDFRSEADYLAGHIPGAINSSLGTLLSDVASKALPVDTAIIVVCYTGQSAGHAKIALELVGYENVQSLKFGMSSWHTSLASSWDNNTGDALADPETTNNNGDLFVYEYPALTGYDAATVVATRVGEVLADGFKGITYQTLVDNGLENYFIVNYFGEADYEGTGSAGVPGHIPGAYQYTPYASLGIEEMLNNLPTDMPVVTYCWTGQHSSQLTAYLNMLGYEAYSLKFGSNALFHGDLLSHVWDGTTNEFPLEVGYPPSEAFAAMTVAGEAYVNVSTECPGVIAADVLFSNGVTNYTVIDLRSEAIYDDGHIEGAYWSTLSTLVDDLATTIPTGNPYVVACYTGQSAGHAKIAMELLGYSDVQSLKFGMSSWHTSLASSWDNNTGDALADPETTNNNGDLFVYEYPALTGYDAATVVATRVGEVLADGFKGITYQTLVDNGLENYFIVNYFGEADYEGTGSAGVPGHIPGAFQFTPYASMGIDEMLAYLPTDMPVVVYCWTGQHSSQITAYLNMLGYEALSLKFGSNALFHDDLLSHVWNGTTNEFPLFATK